MRVLQGYGLGAVQDAPRENTDAERHDPLTSSGQGCVAINAASEQSDTTLQIRATPWVCSKLFRAVVPRFVSLDEKAKGK
jgi:hypothetical protein